VINGYGNIYDEAQSKDEQLRESFYTFHILLFMNILITGGEGFIGRNLKDQLLRENNEVLTLDITGKPIFKCTILNYSDVLEATKNIDVIFHLAATTSPPQFESDLFTGFDTNVKGTLNVLNAAVFHGVKRIILASSSAVYGDIKVPGNEDMKIFGHNNMYATTKLFDEYLGRYFSLRDEIEVVSLRYFNVYGNGENTKGMYSSVISKFFDSILSNKMPVIFGDGKQSRDLVFIKDTVDASIRAMKNGISGNIYNVGTGVATQFNHIVEVMSKLLGREILPKYENNPFKNYQMFTQANIEKISHQLNWKSKYSIENGISEMARISGLI
jgi:UDP-glucose 4-epimerase